MPKQKQDTSVNSTIITNYLLISYIQNNLLDLYIIFICSNLHILVLAGSTKIPQVFLAWWEPKGSENTILFLFSILLAKAKSAGPSEFVNISSETTSKTSQNLVADYLILVTSEMEIFIH